MKMAAYNPGGFSGGGIWLQVFSKDKLWAAEYSKLVGIQGSWRPEKRYLRGTQIAHWLKLVSGRLQDTVDTINQCFPNVVSEPHVS